MAETETEQRPWLTLAEASRVTGQSPDALRALIRRDRLPARKGNAGQWLVQVGDRILTGARPVGDQAATEEVSALRKELTEARLAAVRSEADAATARSEATVLRAALDRECARADRYEAELARLRKPLWERVLEALRRR